jgi:cell division septum initiation protein DivIVA
VLWEDALLMAEPQPIRDAHDEARRIRHDAERRARDIVEEAREESTAALAQARAAADAVLEDAKRLGEALTKAAEALTGEADRLVRDVQLAHRELLASLRLPGIAERETGTRLRPHPDPEELFEPPDWIRGR